MDRTHTCGELRTEDVNDEVTLVGWVQRLRDHGNKLFIDLRDRYGLTQVVLESDEVDGFDDAGDIDKEALITVHGKVKERLEGTENEDMDTGNIELHAKEFEIVSGSDVPPFSIDDEKRQKIDESIRFEHRYLDLRNRDKQQNIINRHKFFQNCRNFLTENDFVEVETPYLTKSTPEGARDFLVPARKYPGEFYALPQSPQLFKQLLMVSGLEKYFQVVKCFRDEDTRKDRQPEFTQLDLEVSFLGQDEFIELMEGMIKQSLEEVYGIEVETPMERITYEEALNRYGSDRPDLRYEMELHNLSQLVKNSDFEIFSESVKGGDVVKSIKLEEQGELSNRYMDKLEETVKDEGAEGLLHIEVGEELEGPMLKHIEDSILEDIVDEMEAEKGDIIFIVVGKRDIVNSSLGSLRRELGENFELYDEDEYEFIWIMDFPLFQYEDGDLKTEHHPFTAPKDIEKFMNMNISEKEKFAEMDADAYDLVLNGFEIGGGSKRIHLPDVQEKVFDLLGLEDEEVEQRFGWFLEAFNYSPPPHRGIAFGADRIFMIMEGEPNIREVIPFPKSKTGYDYITGGPAPPREGQLDEFGIEVDVEEEVKD